MQTKDREVIAQLVFAALTASKKAGDAILEVYNSDFAVELKDDRSPLTLADKRSHEIILSRMNGISPDLINRLFQSKNSLIPVLSEEGKGVPFKERENWEYFWLVDPLDGTKEFVKRNGEFTVNIALIHLNRPVLGVIYIPVKDRLYFGAEGLGSYKLAFSRQPYLTLPEEYSQENFNNLISSSDKINAGKDARPSDGKMQRTTVIGSRSHMSKETEDYISDLKMTYSEVDFVSAGSSIKFCLIAEGTADIYPRFGPTMEWDTAAGQAIVEQAGGKVLKISSNEPLRYNKENLLNPFFVVKGAGI
jgi:3'(2'), 5'-bisphosphate nucleotidase